MEPVPELPPAAGEPGRSLRDRAALGGARRRLVSGTGRIPHSRRCVSILMTLSFAGRQTLSSFFKEVGEACGCLGNLVNMSHTTSLTVDFVMLSVAGLLI